MIRSVHRRLVTSLVATVALAGPAVSAEIPTLPQIDALAVHVDAGIRATPPTDVRQPLEKISPYLVQRMSKMKPTPLEVIVLLHEPLELSGAGKVVAERMRTRILARLEQDFVARTLPLGLQPIRGLSHLPIVIATIPGDQLEALAADPAVEAVDPDLRVHASRTEGAALMHADQLRTQYNGTGAGIGVAVLDTGIDVTHPELAGQVTAKGNYTDDPGDGTTDVEGHGTAVAGIIAGSTGGIARQAHLWTLKVLGDDGSGSLADMISALNDVLANHTNFGGAHVVNMSLGGLAGANGDQPWSGTCDGDIPSLASAVNGLVNAGIAVIAAAGNEGCKNGIGWPACISNVLSVGAVYDANLGGVSFSDVTCAAGEACTDYSTAAGKVTCYSNSGSNMDVWAPSHCASTTKSGGGYESCFGGTSASAPYVSGVAAQLYQLVPGLTPASLKSALTSTGQLVTDPANGISKHLVDAVAAYQKLAGGGDDGGGNDVKWVEWVVHASGSGGSQWRSDVGFLNRGSGSADLTFTVRLTDGRTIRASSSSSISPGEQAWFEDVLGQLDETGKGSLKLESTQPGEVTARLYNQTTSGTYGQFFDGHSSNEGLSAGQSAVIPMLRQDSQFRTNLSVTNMGSSTASVTVTLYTKSGATAAVLSRTLQPGESYQWVEPYSSAGSSDVVGHAVVRVSTGSGIVASASVIDRRTGDPSTVTMRP